MPTSNSDNQRASSSKMQDLIEDRSRFRANDIELLKTGQFSDAQMIVGGRVWNVHKSIVCMRSGFLNKALSGSSKAGEIKSVNILQTYTEKQVEWLLEFIYSGRIEGIGELYLDSCVQLSMLGEFFLVKGMVSYATKALWHKLTAYLQTVPANLTNRNIRPSQNGVSLDLRRFTFEFDLTNAVHTAYGIRGSSKTCQLILADFVWITRDWLLREQIIEKLNTTFPLFGSHILVTLMKGPQTSFPEADGQLQSAANKPASTFGTNYALGQVEGADQAMQLFGPESR